MSDLQAYGADAVSMDLRNQVAIAREFPRDLRAVRKSIEDLVNLDKEQAAQCVYAVPRAGGFIVGPSVRFAECLLSEYGNLRLMTEPFFVNTEEGYIEARALLHDLQNNRQMVEVARRSIRKNDGGLYPQNMWEQIGAAAQSVARRNVILHNVPRALWAKAYERALSIISGDLEHLPANRAKALNQLKEDFGIEEKAALEMIGVKKVDEITPQKMVMLRGLWSGIKSGEVDKRQIERVSRAATKMALPPAATDRDSRTVAPAAATGAKNAQAEQPAPEAADPHLAEYGQRILDALNGDKCTEADILRITDEMWPQGISANGLKIKQTAQKMLAQQIDPFEGSNLIIEAAGL